MTLADARARCPDLLTAPHDPHEDAKLLAVLARRMGRFTPMVALDPPDGLVLDITGCAHLFGGEAALARLAMAEAGLTARPALADHAAAARALARYERGQAGRDEALRIRALPIAALELSEASLSGLRRAGLKTLGDLASRPMGALAARFGEEAVTKLRAILGEAGSPLAPVPRRRRSAPRPALPSPSAARRMCWRSPKPCSRTPPARWRRDASAAAASCCGWSAPMVPSAIWRSRPPCPRVRRRRWCACCAKAGVAGRSARPRLRLRRGGAGRAAP